MTGARVTPEHGVFDAWVLTGHSATDGITFIRPGRKQERLDHCAVTSELIPAVQSMHIDAGAQGSDHQPILLTLDLARAS